MKIQNLTKHNIISLNIEIPIEKSIGIAGLSGSGKTTFCRAITDEFKRRMISLLPKSDRNFLFKDLSKTDFGCLSLQGVPSIKFFHQDGVILSPRSTLGTHTGIFKSLRRIFATKYNLSIQFFSYNNLTESNSNLICGKCKGRGTFGGDTCPLCNGTRYTKKIEDYYITVSGRKFSLLDLFRLPISQISEISSIINLPPKDRDLLKTINELELGYLSLDRTFGTLSGGEVTRIQLAEAISFSKHNLIIVDELSHGLDYETLKKVISVVSVLGQENVLWFIDHSDLVLNATEEKLYFGPRSGADGGKVIDYSPRPKAILPETPYVKASKFFSFSNLHCRNINLTSLRLPQNCIIAISGKSGCGKSTLMRDCVLPFIKERMPDVTPLVVEQNKAKMVTKSSTLATFLGIASAISQKAKVSKMKCRYCFGSGLNENAGRCEFCDGTGIDRHFFDSIYTKTLSVGDLYNLTVAEILDKLNSSDPIFKILSDVDFLGISHLSLSRSIRTLSAGEYQALYLVSCLNSLQSKKKYFLFLDEPTKGLSQNIINQLMLALRKLQQSFDITIAYIEHVPYMLQAADYIIDFGSIRLNNVTALSPISHDEWQLNCCDFVQDFPIVPSMNTALSGIKFIKDPCKAEQEFNEANNRYHSILRDFSDTANWIYSSFSSDENTPTLALDFAGVLYSSGTRLWEVGNVISQIVSCVSSDHKQAELFDFHNPMNHCLSCKGTGVIHSIDFSKCFVNQDEAWNSGLFDKDIYSALRNYNFSRVSRMFQALKKIREIDLSKPFSSMNEEEKNTFMFGDWNFQLPGKEDRTYVWRGFNFLVQKYMRESLSPMKQILKDSLHEMVCPVCHGRTLRHRELLLYNNRDIFEYLSLPLKKILSEFEQIDILADLLRICGEQTSLYDDVSKMNKGVQVICKIFDLYTTHLVGFNVFLKNLPAKLPVYAEDLLAKVSAENSITICSTMNNDIMPIAKMFPRIKCTEKSFAFQLLGFKNVDKEIRAVKANNRCQACKGKGSFAVTSDNDDINSLSEICSQCLGSGIASSAQQQLVAGIPINCWITGDMHLICPQIFPKGFFFPILKKLSDLNQGQLESLADFLRKE